MDVHAPFLSPVIRVQVQKWLFKAFQKQYWSGTSAVLARWPQNGGHFKSAQMTGSKCQCFHGQWDHYLCWPAFEQISLTHSCPTRYHSLGLLRVYKSHRTILTVWDPHFIKDLKVFKGSHKNVFETMGPRIPGTFWPVSTSYLWVIFKALYTL